MNLNFNPKNYHDWQNEVHNFFCIDCHLSLVISSTTIGPGSATICFLVISHDCYSKINLDGRSVIKMPIGINLVIVITTDITEIVNYFVVNQRDHRHYFHHHKLITQVHYQTDLTTNLKIISTLLSSSFFNKFSSGYRSQYYNNLMCPIILIIISTSLVSASTPTTSSLSPSSSSSTTSNNGQSGRRIKSQTSSVFNLRMAQNNDLASSSSSTATTSSSIDRITTNHSINTFWLVAIIFNATLAALFFLIFCYLCLKKSLQSKQGRLTSRNEDALFTRKSVPTSNDGQKQSSSVYTIPMDKNLLSVNLSNNKQQPTAINKFKVASRLTGRMMTSSPIQSNNTMSTLGSFSESIPSSPAKYEPPPKSLQGPFDKFQASVDENAGKIVGFTGSEATHAAKSLLQDNIKLAPVNPTQVNRHINNNNNNNHQMKTDNILSDNQVKVNQFHSTITDAINHNNQQSENLPIQQYNTSPLPVSSLSLSSSSSATASQLVGEPSTTNTNSNRREAMTEAKDLIVDKVLNYEKLAVTNSDKKNNNNRLDESEDYQQTSRKHRDKKVAAVSRDLHNIGSQVMAKLRNDRKASVSIQTSPTIWLGTVNVKNDPSIAWEPHPVYSEPYSPNHDSRLERKYFIYLVSDATPYFRKNCIGKITLPVKSALTLSQLRDMLLKAEDPSLKDVLKKNRSFRFLTETYRFVAQNEAIAPIDQVYPTQGIFIKLSAPDYSIMPTNENSDKLHHSNITTKPSGHGNRRGTYRDDVKFASFINISDTNTDKISSKENVKQKRVTNLNHQVKREIPIYQEESTSEPVATSDPRKRCARPTCNKPAIMGCGKCNNAFYCCIRCKNLHFSDHRSTCSKPPWRF